MLAQEKDISRPLLCNLAREPLIPILFQFFLLTPSGGFAATSLKEGGGM